MNFLGAHVSVAGGLPNGIVNGEKLGCSAIQIFLKNPHRWKSKAIDETMIDQFREKWENSSIAEIIAHDIHLTNLASPKTDVLKKSLDHFKSQIEFADKLGVRMIVKHLGSHLGVGEEIGLRTLSESVDRLLDQTQHTNVSLLLETTAGQGNNLGYRFEHLREMIDRSNFPDRLGVCFDTCHVFAAGYDLRTAENYHKTFDQFDRIVGLDRIKAFHINDSKSDFHSRVDRHEHIGKGKIGEIAFELLMNDDRFVKIPKIIETPEMNKRHYENLEKLRSLKRIPK